MVLLLTLLCVQGHVCSDIDTRLRTQSFDSVVSLSVTKLKEKKRKLNSITSEYIIELALVFPRYRIGYHIFSGSLSCRFRNMGCNRDGLNRASTSVAKNRNITILSRNGRIINPLPWPGLIKPSKFIKQVVAVFQSQSLSF